MFKMCLPQQRGVLGHNINVKTQQITITYGSEWLITFMSNRYMIKECSINSYA